LNSIGSFVLPFLAELLVLKKECTPVPEERKQA